MHDATLLSGVVATRDYGRDTNKSGEIEPPNRDPLAKICFVVVALLLIAGALTLARYVVKREDYLHIVLVFAGLPLFVCGGLLLFLVFGLFD